MNNTMAIPMTLSAGSMENYIQSLNRVPILTAEEEYTLAKRYHESGDIEAARQLVLAHLRFVVKIAKGYSGYGLLQSDLVQEGSVGLMKAVKRFDPGVGVRLVSFAVYWIRAEIHEYILRNWKIVKIATTKAQRKLFFNLRSYKKRLAWLNKDEVDSVARDLGVKSQEVIEMEKRLSNHDISLDLPETDQGTTKSFSPVACLEDKNPGPMEILESEQLTEFKSEVLNRAIGELDARSQDIINKRWLNGKKQTLQQLAGEYGVSAERVRQLEKSAFNKIQRAYATVQ